MPHLPFVTPAAADDALHLALSGDDRAPGQARRAVRAVLERWHLPTLVDAVVLAVSELVTNAVRHGRPPVDLTVSRGADVVLVQVHDEDAAELPQVAPADPFAESGRGLDIVAAVSRTCGVSQVPDDGKIAFATFDLPPQVVPAPAATGAPLSGSAR